MYICTCIYIQYMHICMYKNIYIHTHTQSRIHYKYRSIYIIHICIQKYTRVYMCTETYTCIRVEKSKLVC